jgi:hypothetical protein
MLYKFIHAKNSRYACTLQYVGDKFKKLEMEFPTSNELSLTNFLSCIHFDIDETIQALAGIGFMLMNEDLPNQVIGVTNIPPTINYCGIWVDSYYKKWQIKYIIKPKEAKILKELALEKEEFIYLIKFFFDSDAWFAKTKDITSFVTHINEIRRLQTVPKEVTKQKFPNYWTKQEEQKYAGTELTEYWTHLRSLGWKKEGTIWEAPAKSFEKVAQNLHNKFNLNK